MTGRKKFETSKSCYANTEKNNNFLKKGSSVVKEVGSFVIVKVKDGNKRSVTIRITTLFKRKL
jgi:hypothetical protein